MADRKITDLTALAAGNQATGDLLTIVDVSEVAAADKNKKITVESLFKGIPGNVGIGTSSPSTKLDVNGDVTISAPEGTSAALLLQADEGDDNGDTWRIISNQDDNDLTFSNNVSGSFADKVTFRNNGHVGLGANNNSSYDSAAQNLLISDTSASSGITIRSGGGTPFGAIHFADGTSNNDQKRAGRIMYGHSGDFMLFSTANSERLRIDSSGNVGIGTTSPSAALHAKSGTTDVVADFESGDANAWIQIRDNSTTDTAVMVGAVGDDMRLRAGSNERMRIDSSGNVGINRSAPDNQLSIGSTASFHTDSNSFYLGSNFTSTGSNFIGTGKHAQRLFFNNASGNGYLSYSNTSSTGTAGNAITWEERIRITSDGILCVNRTSAVHGGQLSLDYTNGTTAGLAIKDKQTSGTGVVLQVVNGSGTIVGSITQNQSTTAFNTSSDYRLKENVVDVTDGITRVKQLQPKRFNFIADDSRTVDGFLAHEAQTVVPEAVTGTHNEVDVDNNPVYQGIDQSKLVPLLTAALQEAIAEIETLKTKVAALEAG